MTDYQFQAAGGEPVIVRVAKDASNFVITLAANQYQVSHAELDSGFLKLVLDGKQVVVPVVRHKGTIWVAIEGVTFRLEQLDGRPRRRHVAGTGASTVVASMPGTILEILVDEKDSVKQGQPVIIMEAMKMELRLTAPKAGRIEKIWVRPGELVQQGMVLLSLEKD